VSTTLKRVYGYLAEFSNAQELYRAAEKVRDKGFRRWDVHSPYPIHGMDGAMGLGRSRLPYLVIWGGALGLATGFLLPYITQVLIYPTVVQAKPTTFATTPAFFPVMFELTILFSAFSTLFGVMALMGLPRWNHPVFASRTIERATDDAFFIAVEARDPLFSREETRKFLEEIGAIGVELVEDEL